MAIHPSLLYLFLAPEEDNFFFGPTISSLADLEAQKEMF